MTIGIINFGIYLVHCLFEPYLHGYIILSHFISVLKVYPITILIPISFFFFLMLYGRY